MAALADTNVLVYRFDPRFRRKQRVATDLLRWGAESGSISLPHQAIVEFVAAVTRSRSGAAPLLTLPEALREADDLQSQFDVVYPDEEVVQTALRGVVAHQLSWFDAHLWAYAQVFGFPEILSEDFEHDRTYGSVRVVNPFVPVEMINEPPAAYGR